MRIPTKLFLIALVAFLAAWVWFGLSAPAAVPAHFNSAGQVDRWDSKFAFLAVIGVLAAVLALLFGTMRHWLGKMPAGLINLPSRRAHAYWTAEERRAELDDAVADCMECVGAACLLLMTAILGISGWVAAGHAVGVGVFVALLIGFLAVTAGAIAYLLRRLRVPPQS